MIITLMFETNDVVEDAMNEHHCDEMPAPEIEERLRKFIQSSEYMHIEFDLEKGTAKVLEAE